MTAPNIPAAHFLAASKDAKLKLLLRQRGTAVNRIQRAIDAETAAARAVAEYITATYPAEFAVGAGLGVEVE